MTRRLQRLIDDDIDFAKLYLLYICCSATPGRASLASQSERHISVDRTTR